MISETNACSQENTSKVNIICFGSTDLIDSHAFEHSVILVFSSLLLISPSFTFLVSLQKEENI